MIQIIIKKCIKNLLFNTPSQYLRLSFLTIFVLIFLLKVFKNLLPELLTNFINYSQPC